MSTVEACPRCGAYVTEEGYCTHDPCDNSEKSVTRDMGSHGSPPFADDD